MTDYISSQTDVRALPSKARLYRAWDARTPGLCVYVQPTGVKRWFYEYRDADGKRQAFRIGDAETMAPAEARRRVKKLGTDPQGEKRRRREGAIKRHQGALQTFLDGEYRTHYLEHQRSGSASYERIRTAWAPLLSRDMAKLTVMDIERVRRARLKAGVSPQTLNRDWSALRALLNVARKKYGLLDTVPEVEALKTADDKRVRYLDDDERARFLAALADSDPHVQAIVRTAYWTGLRRGELFGLTWRDIDFVHGRITVRAATAKTATTRHLPMHPELRAVLLEWQGRGEHAGLVFPSPVTGKRLIDIKRAWGTLCRRAGIVDFHFHDLRHDFASRLVMNGTDLQTVRDLLGHRTIAQSEKYAHLSPGHHRAAMDALTG